MITYENAMMELNFPGSIGNQKKRRIAELLSKMQSENAVLRRMRHESLEWADELSKVKAQLAVSQRRERAAVADLELRSDCGFCAKAPMNGGSCYPDDLDCPGWDWRGPQEAGEGDQA